MSNMKSDLFSVTSLLDKLLLMSRGFESALALALRMEDAYSIRNASEKLGAVVAASYAAVDSVSADDPQVRNMLSLMLEQAMEVPSKLLAKSLRCSSAGRSTIHVDVELLEPPSLVGLRGYGRQCRDLALQNLLLINCDVGSDFSGSSFVQVSMSNCRFAYSRLTGTLWQEARIDGTSFRGCDFLGAQIGDAMFVDCDFHGARIGSALVNATNARFIRCNFTDGKWGKRSSARHSLDQLPWG